MEKLRLQLALTRPLMASKGYAANEVEEVCNQALAVCEEMPDSLELFTALAVLCSVFVNRGQLGIGMAVGQRMLRIAEGNKSTILLLWVHYLFGIIYVHQADYTLAREHLECCLELYDRKQAGSYGFLQDPGSTALTALATVIYNLGFPDLALKRICEAFELAR